MSRPVATDTAGAPTLRHRSTGSGTEGSLRVLCNKRDGAGLSAGGAVRAMNERLAPLSVLLTAAERALASDLEDGLRAAGHDDLRAAHAQVFVALDMEGSRLTELAARAGMTKQAMGELVRYLEHHGYLAVEPDSRDRRAGKGRPAPPGPAARPDRPRPAAAGRRRRADARR